MKDTIQKISDEVSIVIYDAPLPPKYFRLKKSFIKTLTIFTPLFILFVIGVFFLWGIYPRLENAPSLSLPSLESETEKEINSLTKKVESLTSENEALVIKISSTPGEISADDPYLMMIKKPYGMQNLLPQNRVFVENIEVAREPTKATLKFQIVSSIPEKKVTGHILVFMLSDSTGLTAYPSKVNESLKMGVKYSQGESFSVSRLRPTIAEFMHQAGEENVRFMIYIFSKEGDLLLIRETESFKIGSKS